jgi:hypothetical protein
MAQAPFTLRPDLVAIANDYSRVNGTRRGYIADQVMPRVRVDSPQFEYMEFPVDEAFFVPDTQVDRLGRLNELVQAATTAAGAVKDWGLAQPVPYRDQMAAQKANIPFSPLARATRNVTDKVQLAREVRVANYIFSAANYQTGYKVTVAGTGAGGQWSAADSDPVQQVNDAADGMLVKPNVLVVNQRGRSLLRRNAALTKALGGSSGEGRYAPDSEIAEVLGVERIIVGNTIRATSKRGQNLTTGKIWGNHAALLFVPPTGPDGLVDDDTSPAFGLTFQWNDNVAGTYEDPTIGLYGGQRVKAGESLIEKGVAPFAGYFFENAYA